MEAEFRDAVKRIEELTREFEKTEGKLVELQIKYNKVKSDKHHAEKAAEKSRKELKKLSQFLNENKVREHKEMQMLSEMLTMTMSPRSTHRSNTATAQIYRSLENS